MLILRHGSTAERYPYAQYARDMDGFSRQRKQELRQMLKRGAFTFGRILFHSDARLAVLQDSQQETLSLEERCRILQQENDELKNQLKDFTQQNTDMRMNGEQLRIYQKQLAEKEAELERRNAAYQVLEQEYDSKKKFLSAVHGDRAVLSGKSRHCRDIPHETRKPFRSGQKSISRTV